MTRMETSVVVMDSTAAVSGRKKVDKELNEIKSTFTLEEIKRDQLIAHTVYTHYKSDIGKTIASKLSTNEDSKEIVFESKKALSGLIGGTFSFVSAKDHPQPLGKVDAPDNGQTLHTLPRTCASVSWYEFPAYERHINKLLPNAKIPEKALTEEDLTRVRRYGFGGRNSIAYLAANQERDRKRQSGTRVNRSWGSAEPRNKKMRNSYNYSNNRRWQEQQRYNAGNGLAPAGRGMVSVAYPGSAPNHRQNSAYGSGYMGSNAYPGAAYQVRV